MPELIPKNRLQPALLDRLTDHTPHVQSEVPRERVVSHEQLREGVLRDLSWLLNSARPNDFIDAARFPFVAESVLNYGLPSWGGLTTSSLLPERVAADIAQAIHRFEPRILADTLRVTPLKEKTDQSTRPTLPFFIEGVLWAQPYPEHLYYRADLDLEDSIFWLREARREM